jgi:hypothetical protein
MIKQPAPPSQSGRAGRTGEEAPYTSEAFEVSPDVGTDSPLGPPSTEPAGEDADAGDDHAADEDER